MRKGVQESLLAKVMAVAAMIGIAATAGLEFGPAFFKVKWELSLLILVPTAAEIFIPWLNTALADLTKDWKGGADQLRRRVAEIRDARRKVASIWFASIGGKLLILVAYLLGSYGLISQPFAFACIVASVQFGAVLVAVAWHLYTTAVGQIEQDRIDLCAMSERTKAAEAARKMQELFASVPVGEAPDDERVAVLSRR